MNHLRTGVAFTGTLTLLLTTAAEAQEPNPLGTLTFSQGLEISDNPALDINKPGTVVTSVTGLGFALDASTRVQTFRLSLGTSIEGEFGPGAPGTRDFEFVNERASLSYGRESASTVLDFNANYNKLRFEDIAIQQAFDPDFLIIDAGSRERTSLALGLQTGRNSRIGFDFGVRYSKTDYLDTIDPQLIDDEKWDVDAAGNFALTRSLTGRLLAGVSVEDEATGVRRENSYVGVGLAGETRGGLTFSTDVTFDRSETSDNGTLTSEQDGVGFSLAFSQDRPLGAYNLSIGSRVDDAGRSSRINLGRTMDLPRGSLSWSIGVEDFDNTDPDVIGSVAFTRQMRASSFTASLSRDSRVDNSVPYTDTRLSLTYQGELSPVSNWSASLSYFEDEELNGPDDSTRTSATVGYSRELTEDWRLNTGYSYTRVENPTDDRDRNTVFLNLQRDITFGF